MYPIEKEQTGRLQEMLEPPFERLQPSRTLSLRALLIEPTNNTLAQFVRYTVVGGVALTADFGTLFLSDPLCGSLLLGLRGCGVHDRPDD